MITQSGKIKYFFKGMHMQSEDAIVVDYITKKQLSALRKSDKQIFEFVYLSDYWVLKNHENSNSLLHGTQFVLNE